MDLFNFVCLRWPPPEQRGATGTPVLAAPHQLWLAASHRQLCLAALPPPPAALAAPSPPQVPAARCSQPRRCLPEHAVEEHSVSVVANAAALLCRLAPLRVTRPVFGWVNVFSALLCSGKQAVTELARSAHGDEINAAPDFWEEMLFGDECDAIQRAVPLVSM